ncbi:MAG: putative DNA binding domain-containing protein [Candidatus Azobacteroides sp.]|nr:putative DNA binding domain-containing protein [Candidatus Azobacteroides sp.]
MNKEELLEVIRSGETSRVQFKREFDNQDKIAAEMIAFANSKGGMLLFGIDDKTGEIIKLEDKEIQKIGNRVATIANELVNPPVYITTEVVFIETSTDKKKVLVIYVDEGIHKPYKDNNGTIWQKQGADKRKLTENHEIMRLFQQGSNLSADEMTIYGTGIEDVDERLFSDYFMKEFKRPYQEKGLTYEDALRVKRILFGDKVTLAGLLFFGREPQKFRPAFTIKLVAFVGNDLASLQYRSKPEDAKGTIPEMFKQAMSFLTSNLRYMQQQQGFNSVGIPEISPVALEEILQNALIHRDYFKNAPVRVFIFDNRIEIISPGKLPNNLTIEDIKYGNPVIRNNLIVAFGIHTLPYSGLGTGIRRALELQPDIELINDVETEQFIVKIPRPLTQ